MSRNPLNVLSSFFAHRLTRQVKELYASSIILDFAACMVSIFEPVFLYIFFSQTHNLQKTLELIIFFYLLVYIPYFFLVPFGAKFARRFGYENSIALSTPFIVLMYFLLFSANRFAPAVWLATIPYIIFKALYWPSYHSNFAKFSSDGEQGRAISNLYVILNIVYVISPLVGGLIVQFYGFKVLFVVTAILILVSNVPMLITKEKFDPKPFSYREAFKRIFAKENRLRLWANLGFGEEWIILTIWPIFVFLVVGTYLNLGIFSAISTLISLVVLLFIGRWTDKSPRQQILGYGIVFYFFSWLLKLVTRLPWGVLLLDVFSRISKDSLAVPITAFVYKDARDGSVMNSIVFFEMTLVLGKIAAMIICFLALQLVAPGWNTMFIVGAMFTLFYLFYRL
ncbi:MAG: MFS transporter [Patescibacteria group bacterium]|jgi:MFS family permease